MTARSGEQSTPNSNIAGILYCVLAMLLFAVGNGFTKVSLETFSVAQTMMLRVWSLMLLSIVYATLRGGLMTAIRARRPVLQLARGGFLVADQLVFSVTLLLLGLAEMHALYATAPLLTMALAAPLLGERIGWRHWLAVLVGFLGALVIVRPGGAVFQPASALALFGALMYAFYSLSTRLASHTDSNQTSLLYTSVVGVLVTTPFGIADWQTPALGPWLMLATALAFSLTAHVLVIRAYALAPASTLQPFNYVLLAAGTAIGIGVFGERPDLLALFGTAAIAVSGLYIAWHESRVSKSRRD